MAFVCSNSLLRTTLLMLLGYLSLAATCNGKLYRVGDSAGWTTLGNVDYKQWAATKTFRLGDVVVFKYNPQFHNVMQVTHSAYKACNASAPIAVHITGNDTVTVSNHGHHFFICGIPGHCQSGQKVDINVLRSSPSPSSGLLGAPAPSPVFSPATAASATSTAPAPSPTNVASTFSAPTKLIACAMTVFLFVSCSLVI